jgi:UDP-GlcNAc:undecaprenyl-phosphate GlcNAc-1-phosphate transferase
MFIPILDLLLAVVRRTRAGVSPFSPDKMHLHHRLLQIGHSHRRVVLLIYLWVGVLAFGAVGTALLDRRVVVLLLAGGLVFALVVTAVPSMREGRE